MIERDLAYELSFTDSMQDELEKLAVSPAQLGRLIGLGIGAAGGAGLGAAASPNDRLRGALYGGAAGAALGLGAGQVATGMGRGQVARLGQRQLHGLTGWRPKKVREALKGARGEGAKRKIREQWARDVQMIPEGTPRFRNVGEARGYAAYESAHKKGMFTDKPLWRAPQNVRDWLARSKGSELYARQQAVESGLTSAPGLAAGLVRNPVATARTGIAAGGISGAAMTGLYGASVVPGMIRGGTGWGGEYHRPGGVGRLAGESLAFGIAGPTPFGGAMALSSGLGALGSVAQRGTQRAVGAIRGVE